MTGLFPFQYLAAVARLRSDTAEMILQNEPVFLMKDGDFIGATLKETRFKASDVYAKLREANALRLADVHAVILETIGDISILHGGSPSDDQILLDVR